MRKWINVVEGRYSGLPDEDFDKSLLGPTGKFVVYHAGRTRLRKVMPFIHVGTEQAALDLANEKYSRSNFFLHTLELIVTQSCEILDSGYGQHDVEGIMSYLETTLSLDMNEVESVFRDRVASAKLLRRYGYDALWYRNHREDPGSISWVVLDPSKLKLISVEEF